MGRSPQICTVTNFREEFWISPLWCLFFCFSLTFGVYVMKKYIPELSYFFSQFSSHIYMSRVRTWQLTFSPNHMKWTYWINKITFFYQYIYKWKQKAIIFKNWTTIGWSGDFFVICTVYWKAPLSWVDTQTLMAITLKLFAQHLFQLLFYYPNGVS